MKEMPEIMAFLNFKTKDKMRIKTTIYLILSLFALWLMSCNSSVSSEKMDKRTEKEKKIDSAKVADIKDKTEKVDKFLKFFFKETELNGVALVSYQGEIISQKVQGYANKKANEMLKLTTRFQLASVSKPFTATAIMILYQDSLLKLDDEVSKYLTGFPYKGITIRMLLTHRSGLANYMYFSEKLTNRKNVIYNQDVVNMMVKSKPAPYLAFNTKHDYCNTNYALLASIIEKISGITYKEFMQKRIFDVAGMKNSFFYEEGKVNPTENVALGYHYRWEVALHTYQEGVLGDKGLYATVEDLFNFDRALYEEKILKKETLALMHENGNPELEKSNYGFGWRIPQTDPFKGVVYHGGWYRGFNTIFVRDLKTQSTVVMFSNVRTRILGEAFHEIIRILRNEERNEVTLSALSDTLAAKLKRDSLEAN